MSLNALKRKSTTITRNKNKNLTNEKFVVRGPGQIKAIVSGSGFSLNGKYRNIGNVGSNSLFSKRGPTMKPGTNNWKGYGGKYNSYKNVNLKATNNYCSETLGCKPSTLNTKGMISTKYKWSKKNINDEVFTDLDKELPKNNNLKNIHNRWVSGASSGGNELNSSSQYTEKLVSTLEYKNRNIPKPEKCKTYCNNNHMFGRKYKCDNSVSQFNEFIGSSSRAISGAIANRASLFPKGYNKPWPPLNSSNGCGASARQVSDPNVLNGYYKEGNVTPVTCPNLENNC